MSNARHDSRAYRSGRGVVHRRMIQIGPLSNSGYAVLLVRPAGQYNRAMWSARTCRCRAVLAIALVWGGFSTRAMAQQAEALPPARPGPGIPSAASATSSVTTGPAPAALVASPTTATAQPPPDPPSIHVTGKLLEIRQLDPSGKSVVQGSVTLPRDPISSARSPFINETSYGTGVHRQ